MRGACYRSVGGSIYLSAIETITIMRAVDRKDLEKAIKRLKR